MTIETFDKLHVHAGMKVRYKGNDWDLVSVDWEEKLLGIDKGGFHDDEDEYPIIDWIRCENGNIVKDGILITTDFN